MSKDFSAIMRDPEQAGAHDFKILSGSAVDTPAVSIRARTLDTARSCVMQDRNLQYGPPEDSFAEVAKRWSIHLGVEVQPHDVPLMLIDLKLVRAKKSPRKADHYVDIAGYAACGAETARAE